MLVALVATVAAGLAPAEWTGTAPPAATVLAPAAAGAGAAGAAAAAAAAATAPASAFVWLTVLLVPFFVVVDAGLPIAGALGSLGWCSAASASGVGYSVNRRPRISRTCSKVVVVVVVVWCQVMLR